jgi:hypothetical protein
LTDRFRMFVGIIDLAGRARREWWRSLRLGRWCCLSSDE